MTKELGIHFHFDSFSVPQSSVAPSQKEYQRKTHLENLRRKPEDGRISVLARIIRACFLVKIMEESEEV